MTTQIEEKKTDKKPAAPVLPKPTPPVAKITVQYGDEIAAIRPCVDIYGFDAWVVLVTDMLSSVNQRFLRASKPSKNDELEPHRTQREFERQQWQGQWDRAVVRLKELGAVVSHTGGPEPKKTAKAK